MLMLLIEVLDRHLAVLLQFRNDVLVLGGLAINGSFSLIYPADKDDAFHLVYELLNDDLSTGSVRIENDVYAVMDSR